MEEVFTKTLQKNNKYVTDDRIALFRHLSERNSPLSIQQIFNDLCEQMDEATVYRNIRTFEQLGIVTRVYTGWKYKIELSDTFNHHHHHMFCTNCGEVTSFKESAELEKQLKLLEKNHGFKATSHSLELRGQCQNCC